MATTRRLLRQYLSEDPYVGDWLTETTTAAGGAAGISLVCSALAGISQDANYFKDMWVVLPVGPASAGGGTYEARKVSASTGSTGTLTVSGYRSFSAQVDASGTGVVFELHRLDPAWKHAAIHSAGRVLAGRGLYLPISDVSLVVDGLASNPTFQTYSGGFTGWGNVGTPTIAEETSRILPGFARSASIAATGAIEGLSQNLLSAANQDSIVGKMLKIRAWLFCGTASSMRVRVTFDGVTYYSTDYVAANEWQGPRELKIDQAVPSTLTEITVSVQVATGITGYAQMVAAWIDRVYRYAVPASFRYLDRIYQQASDDFTDDWRLVARNNPPVSGRILKLVGRGALTLPSSDTTSMEVGNADMEPLLKAAASALLNRAATEVTGSDAAELRSRSALAMADFENMITRGHYGQHVAYSNRGMAWRSDWESGSLYVYMEI